MRIAEILNELKKKKVPGAGDTTDHDYNPGWEKLNWIKSRGSRLGGEMTSKYQLFMRRPHAGSVTTRDKRIKNLSNKNAYDDEGNVKLNYDQWEQPRKELSGTGMQDDDVKEGTQQTYLNQMPTKDMINYLRRHHDKNLHQDYLNYLNTFSRFVLKDIPLNSIKTDLSGLDKAKVENYKQMDFSKSPPIVMGDGNILDGYHRATVAKALGIPTIKGYVGIKSQQGVLEAAPILNPGKATPQRLYAG